jgi:hypothetical protein
MLARRLRKLAAAGAAASLAVSLFASPAAAGGWGNGFVCPPKAICVQIRVGGDWGDGGGGGGSSWSRYYYMYERAAVWDPACPGAQAYLMSRVDSQTGDIVFQQGPVCLSPGEPPTPPTPAEVWDRVGIPVPGIGVNPAAEGLTGLDTWLWYEGSRGVTVTVSLRGYTVTATAGPSKYRWGMGDGTTYTTTDPGSEADPAATHMYETREEYPLSLDVTWEGSWSISGWGIDETGLDLGTIAVHNERNYHVIEIRSVLVE